MRTVERALEKEIETAPINVGDNVNRLPNVRSIPVDSLAKLDRKNVMRSASADTNKAVV